MIAEKKVTHNGTIFTVKNISPDMEVKEKSLLLQNISDDLKRAFNRMNR